MKYIIIIFILNFFTSLIYSQDDIKSIEKALKGAKSKHKIYLLKVLSNKYLQVNSKKTIEYAEDGLDLLKKIDDKIFTSNSKRDFYNTIGAAYYYQKKYRKSIKYYEKELKIIEIDNNNNAKIESLYNIATIYNMQEKNRKAISYYEKCLVLSKKTKYKKNILKILQILAEINTKTKRYEKALNYYKEYIDISNKQLNIKTKKNISIINKKLEYEKDISKKLKHETEKKNEKITKLNKETKEKELTIKEKESTIKEKESSLVDNASTIIEKESTIKEKEAIVNAQNTIIRLIISLLLIVLFFTFIAIYLYRKIKRRNIELKIQKAEIIEQNKEIKQQKSEIESQRDYVIEQRDQIYKQNKKIKSSIQYASKIQSALLPPIGLINSFISNYFILFKPRDIVSGDFYWINKVNDKIIVTAADCTGHGVPGAFMSMLGVSFLNDIINKDNDISADNILNKLRMLVKQSLRQNRDDVKTKDGMDMSLCIIDKKQKKIQYSGANNSLYIIRKIDENPILEEIKPDKMPIGVYIKDKIPFTKKEISYNNGDIIYLFSDGYMDQFGGDTNKKLTRKGFKEILMKNVNKPMTEQKTILDKKIESWKGKIDQLDDMLIIGIKL